MKIGALYHMNTRDFPRAIAILVFLCVSACGRKQTAPLSEGAESASASTSENHVELPLDQQTEQKLDPLTADDVALYLKIMRAAAERVKNPAPADAQAIEAAKKILSASASGHVPSLDDVKTLEQANQVALFMDQIVVGEMKADARTYRGITEAIETVIPNPAVTTRPGEDGKHVPEHEPTALENRLKVVNAANEKFLTPYSEEIQKLVAVVRNPANLPK